MATIKAIKASSVHQIQSGQVIVDLNSVVKELVENSLDAGATSIEVRFKNNGLDSIEVQDNGKGIASEDYESIALKHHTSKLESYNDLDSLNTFGFRGEALSSLCALSDFRVVTAVAGAGAKGAKLDFDVSGKLINTSVVAAPQGTTVSVEKLFKNLPVRRKELEKNIKREYAKVLTLLQAYASISTNVRFAVWNTPNKGKKTSVFTTNSNASTAENIANIHGAKTLSALVELDLVFELQPSTTQAAKRLQQPDVDYGSRQVRIKGHISKPVFGEGRQAPDRQTFFVNSRPCLLPQVSKAINEVYKGFNVSQSPFILADLLMDTNAYDVNVSPDKRTILLHDQAELLESLKVALTGLFESQEQTVPTSQLPSNGRLIHDWAGRDAESRQGTQVAPVNRRSLPGYKLSLPDSWNRADSGEKADEAQEELQDTFMEYSEDNEAQNRPVSFATRGNNPSYKLSLPKDTSADPQDRSETGDVQKAETATGADVANGSSSPPLVAPREVQDFNARLLSQQLRKVARPHRITTETVELGDGASEHANGSESPERDEEAIATISTPTRRVPPGPVQNAFDRMRPKRTQEEVATITIGDQTGTMVLGGPDFKRRRIHTPKTEGKSQPQSSLWSFAAPGTHVDARHDDHSQDEDEEGSEDERDDHSEASHCDHDSEHSSPATGQSPPEYQSPSKGLFVEADDSDDEYIDEDEKKAREEQRVAELIRAAEEAAAEPTEETLRRTSQVFRSTARRKDATLELVQTISVPPSALHTASRPTPSPSTSPAPPTQAEALDSHAAEARLSLTISKSDFSRMRIVGQFNLGFILALRPGAEDHLFIIDQHAADEKSNFERLSATTTLAPQRLVTPLPLALGPAQAELLSAHHESLHKNGFEIAQRDDGGYELLTLPTSRETTFSPADLEELLHLLSESAGSAVVRPSRVRRMLAMRACRSSIMVGTGLTGQQMQKVVRQMGGMEKPWNCPHGRPTMRHLAGLSGWRSHEDQKMDWKGWIDD